MYCWAYCLNMRIFRLLLQVLAPLHTFNKQAKSEQIKPKQPARMGAIERSNCWTALVNSKGQQLKPKSDIKPLIKYSELFAWLPVHLSFACWAYCLSYSLDVARYASKSKTDNMLNNKKICTGYNERFGLNPSYKMLQAFQSFLFWQQKESLHLGGFTM